MSYSPANGVAPLPPILTTAEVADVLRCEESTVERYVHDHQLVAVLIGKNRRFRADDVFDFIAARPSTARTGNGGKQR